MSICMVMSKVRSASGSTHITEYIQVRTNRGEYTSLTVRTVVPCFRFCGLVLYVIPLGKSSR